MLRAVVEAAVHLVKHPFRNGKVLVRENPYGLIILEWKMPGMNGIEFAFGDLLVGYNVTLIFKTQYIHSTCLWYSNLLKALKK